MWRSKKVPPPGVKWARPTSSDIAAGLRQTESAKERAKALNMFVKALRRVDRFQSTWDAVGGAAGLASLMAEFSVRGVRLLCRLLGRTGSAVKARPERRKALDDLVTLLCEQTFDKRPIRDFYQDILPGCTLEMVEKWDNDVNVHWTPWQQKRLFFAYREMNGRTFLGDVFESYATVNFCDEKRLFCDSLPFCEEILLALLGKEEDDKIRIPYDFGSKFAAPTLKRLLKRRVKDETRHRFLDLLVRCHQKHSKVLGHQMNLREDGVIQHVVLHWIQAPTEHKEQVKTHLTQLIKALPTPDDLFTLNAIHTAILRREMSPQMRYELLRLFVQHLKSYGFDLEDDTEPGLARLKDLPSENDLWPAKMFFCISGEKAMQLFQKLTKLHPSGDFMSPEFPWITTTLLRQTPDPEDADHADVEIVRCLLIRNLGDKAEHSGWLERARTLVQERRIKAQQSREAQNRAFWAVSALNLCVAAGDLETFGEAILWARRFNKDSLTLKEVYGANVFCTDRIKSLFGAIPRVDTLEAAVATVDSVRAQIELANRILVNLVDTAAMATQEPTFQHANWDALLGFPKVVANWRVKHINKFHHIIKSSSSNDTDTLVQDIVWKPTLDGAVEMEGLLCKSTSGPLRNIAHHVEALGFHVLKKLKNIPASMLAELAKFLLVETRARLGLEIYSLRLRVIVEVIIRISQSDQPALACPFIQHMILDVDENSSWYRKFLHLGFLSTLPARAAREFLHGLADAMTEKMHEQNSRPRNDTEERQPPAIKVTTIKLMAQLLQDNIFIEPQTSCDILVGLLTEARHVDAQITIVDSLMGTMQEPTCPPEMRNRIFDALEKYVVPVAAQLSERRHVTEEDWHAATQEVGAKLPEIGDGTPLLMMLASQASKPGLRSENKSRLANLIMKVLEQSVINNDRWMKLFLAKNKFTLDADNKLPSVSVKLESLALIFGEWTSYMPASLFNLLHAVVLANIDPPPEIVWVSNAVKENGDLVNSNAGRHWLDQFDNAGMGHVRLALDYAAVALQLPAEDMESKLVDEPGISVPMLQDFILAAAERLIMNGDNNVIYSLASKLCENKLEGRPQWESWRSNCIPVINNIVAKVEDVRLKATVPPLLPSTLSLLIKALPIPYSSDEPATADDRDAFISQLSTLIDRLAGQRKPYHYDFSELKDVLLEAPRTSNFARYALQLAAQASSEEPALADYLKLELAGDVLSRAGDPEDKEAVEKAREMVRKWKASRFEEVRSIGYSAEESLGLQGKRSWFFYTSE